LNDKKVWKEWQQNGKRGDLPKAGFESLSALSQIVVGVLDYERGAQQCTTKHYSVF